MRRLRKLHITNGGNDHGRVEFAKPPRKPVWLVSPAVDLLFVCGLAPWILGCAAWLVIGSPHSDTPDTIASRSLTALYVLCALFIGEGHQFTSIVRFHTAKRFWKRWPSLPPVVFMWLGLLSPLGVGLVNSDFGELDLFLGIAAQIGVIVFPIVLVHHFCIQAHAIVLMYCGKGGYVLSRAQTWLFRISMWLLVAGAACGMALPFGLTDNVEATKMAQPWAIPLMVASLLCACLPVWRRGRKTGEWPPDVAMVLWLNLISFLLIPMQVAAYVWVFVPIFFHASQHWIVAYAMRRRESVTANHDSSALLDLLRTLLPVQAVSLVVLFSPLLSLASAKAATLIGTPAGQSMTLPVTWSMWVFYLHYFTDRIVWRPR
jgi:hypothetical protein